MLLPVLTATVNAQEFGEQPAGARIPDKLEFQSIFNGKDLSGWAGKTEFWSVKDGAIFGQTTKDKPTQSNTFLVWQGGDVADFEFKAKVRFAGNNSGVQYRSELFGNPEDFAVKGYQADLHPKPEYFGMLYAEKWRGIVARRFQRVVVGADGKPKVVGEVGNKDQKLVDTEWNELTIIAVGNRQIHQVNGVTTMDLTDNHPEAKRKGILALQLHRGKPMTVEFKDIRLRHLKGEDAKAAINAVTKKAGWTDELHTAYFEWFLKAANYRGGASFAKFIQFIRDDAVASLSETQKKSLKEILAKKPVQKSALENLGAIFAGRSETKWTLDELSQATRTNLKQRDFRNGRKMFAAGGCFACHRFRNQGGMTGPDLTTAGRRYSAHDLLDQVIHPSKVINDQFSAVSVITEDGLAHTGVVVNLSSDRLTLNTDLSDPNKRVNIDRNTIEELIVSKTSPMPTGLFNRMTKDEILDLIAYLISGGDPKYEYFRK